MSEDLIARWKEDATDIVAPPAMHKVDYSPERQARRVLALIEAMPYLERGELLRAEATLAEADGK